MKINSDIKKAKTLPSSFYTSDTLFKKNKLLFENSCQFVCHKSELNNISCYPFDLFKNWIDIPLLISKESQKIRCLSNVCTHRGNILCKEKTDKDKIICNYHGRIFGLDGNMSYAPGFKEAEGFPSKYDNLHEIELLDWNGLLFINTGDNKKMISSLNQMKEMTKWYPFKNLYLDKGASETYEIDAHWTLYCENYLEGLHIPYVHKGLSSDIDNHSYQTTILEHAVLQIAKAKDINDSISEKGIINDIPLNEIYALYFWLFPNTMINFYKWGISINIIEPLEKEKTRIRFISLPLKNNKQTSGNENSVNQIELEDQKIVCDVQRGIKSKYFRSGRYSPKHEKGTHYLHQLICKYIT